MISLIKSYITRQYTNVSPKVILAVLGSFIYLVKKKDIIPDNVPVVGIADDLGVLTLALQLTQNELNAYKAWRDGRAAGDVIEPAPVEEAAADVRAAVQPEEKKSAASIIGDLAKILLSAPDVHITSACVSHIFFHPYSAADLLPAAAAAL